MVILTAEQENPCEGVSLNMVITLFHRNGDPITSIPQVGCNSLAQPLSWWKASSVLSAM